MQLNYSKNKKGLYILKKEDYDEIASVVLGEYQPIMLLRPQPLEVEDLICDKLRLDMKNARLSEDGRIFGAIAFSDTVYNGFDTSGTPVKIDMPEGTMVLEERLMSDMRYIGQQRFAKMHEGAHWILHRQYHSSMRGRNYEFPAKEETSSISCHMMVDPRYLAGRSGKWTDYQWEEWQANNLAAALLMPKATFITVARRIMRFYGIRDTEPLYWDENLGISHRIVDEIKNIYEVSKAAVELRMVRCNLLERGTL